MYFPWERHSRDSYRYLPFRPALTKNGSARSVISLFLFIYFYFKTNVLLYRIKRSAPLTLSPPCSTPRVSTTTRFFPHRRLVRPRLARSKVWHRTHRLWRRCLSPLRKCQVGRVLLLLRLQQRLSERSGRHRHCFSFFLKGAWHMGGT